ncbi:DUF6669 family protein [Lachnospiraceae bacterium 54-53]
MEMIQHFQGTLNHGFRGNIIYNFHLPKNCRALSVILTYDKEHFSHKEIYMEELRPIYESWKGGPVSEEELLKAMDSMKTEIQLALMIHGEFAGNVHMPGTKKELFLSEDRSAGGMPPCPALEGMAKIIVNVFQVQENQTSYRLEIKGEFHHVEKN